MNQEIQAVQSYLAQSSQLKQPNSVKTWGFATDIIPLTANFNTDGTKIIQELNASLQSDLPQRIGGGTNVDLAIQQGSDALALSKGCRHLLIVTDGAVEINPEIVKKAFNQGVKISAIVVEADSVPLRTAAFLTGGKYLIGEKTTLESLFTETLFKDWNNNWRWVIFWLGLAWIAFHWLLVLPLDRWVLQGWLKKRIDDSARIALGNALSWTILTPLILWQLYRLLNLVAPFVAQC
jgi:Ca-activated chloride channel family protein